MTITTITDQAYKQIFIDWLSERLNGHRFLPNDTVTIASVDVKEDGTLDILAVTAFHVFAKHSCEATIASDLSRRTKIDRNYIWQCFNYVFNVAGKTHLQAHVAADNEKSIAVLNLLGLEQIGVHKDLFGEGKDGYAYGISKSQWQKGYWATPEKEEKGD